MIKPWNNVVIVGGGSAGWMTAAMLIKAFPEKNITLVESPSVPIVGVGESTLAHIKDYIEFLEIDEKDFMSYTDASYKMSIKFTDFYEKDAGGFHYPFGEPVLADTLEGLQDWLYKKAIYPDTPVQDFARCYFPAMSLIEQNKFSLNPNNVFHDFNPKFHVAYHFDATKFGQWLAEKYAKPKGVKHILQDVLNINLNDSGIESLDLLDGSKIKADLYIDCTGWRSLLLGKALKEPFNSYEDMLPNNRAWAVRLPYKDKEKELEPFTNCTAIDNGWVWNIPLWSRIGTGYVYSDKFVDTETAKKEFKSHLQSNKMICPRSEEDIEKLDFKDVQMRVGIHHRTWVKNVVAIGLSAGFIEPLESNGLFSVHEFLFKLVKSLQRPAITKWDVDVYNASCLNIFRNFAEFVALHYALSIRNDTAYWKANGDRTYSPGLESLEPQSFQGFYDLQHRKMFTRLLPNNAGISRIAVGMNYMTLDQIDYLTELKRDKNGHFQRLMRHLHILENKKEFWREAAKNEISLYNFLKQNIYTNDD